jgi:hypothetical protein
LVIQEVLNEAQWAELVSPDDKKRAEIITEFFNSVMTDNAAKAVHDMYPLVYEQVLNLIKNLVVYPLYMTVSYFVT